MVQGQHVGGVVYGGHVDKLSAEVKMLICSLDLARKRWKSPPITHPIDRSTGRGQCLSDWDPGQSVHAYESRGSSRQEND